MSELLASAVAVTHVGNAREGNEDSFVLNGRTSCSLKEESCFVSDATQVFCAVCDGVGGEEYGEIASRAAAKALGESGGFDNEAINNSIMNANNAVLSESGAHGKNMGTTVALFAYSNGRFTVANVGDSRVYKLSQGALSQLSEDHTRAQFLSSAGIESVNETDKHVLTQFLGIHPDELMIEPYFVGGSAASGDVFLVCSDGLYDMIDDNHIARIISENADLALVAKSLVGAALDAGGDDNITVILISIR